MLAPVLPAQRLGSTPALISTNHPDVKSGSPSVTLPDGVRPPSESMTCCLVPANHNSGKKTGNTTALPLTKSHDNINMFTSSFI